MSLIRSAELGPACRRGDDVSETPMSYEAFLREKVNFDRSFGFDVDDADINPILLPHQRAIVRWAVAGGRRAIFAAFGLGKSVMQLEVLRLILAGQGGAGLIVCPLGVRQEFVRDAAMLGMTVTFIRTAADMSGDGIYLTNYESIRDGKLDPAVFTAVSLDEASVLRSYGSKTYQTFLPLFVDVPYRFVATATPSPNRHKELIHYAGFLGIMDTGQALTRFFQRDSTQANNLTLYPHKEREFWLWLNTWACFLNKPSDLGFSDEGYDLPEIEVVYHEIGVDHSSAPVDRDGQAPLFRGAALGVSDAAREKRDTLPARVTQAMEVVDVHVGAWRGPEGVSPGVLPAEPGPDARGAEGARLAGGPGEEAGLSQGVLRSEPGSTAGGAAGAGAAELRGQAAELCRPESTEPPASQLRPDAGAVRRDAGRAGRGVRDLSSDAGDRGQTAPSGSLPNDGRGAGHPVRELQPGTRHVPGRPGGPDGGARVPDQIVIWCDLNDEQRALERGLDARGLTYSSIHGAMSTEEVERRLEEWRDRRTYALIGKPVMLGQGVNLQQCNTAVFVGVTHKFNSFVQAIHRIQRYGQTRDCRAHIIHAESEREVVRNLRQKWSQHKELTANMSAVIREFGLNPAAISAALTRSMGVERIEASGEGWLVANNDCVIETQGMADDSVDLIVTSIPFSNHYEYTPSYNDFGHTDDNDHFWAQMDYLTPQLLRVLAPGRIYACHVKDRILFGAVTGAGVPTVSPFHAEALMHGRRHGFDYLGMITVVTDVVRENNQTYRLGWSEQCKDGTKMGAGSPEYILLFHKPQTDRGRGYADVPVVKDKAVYTRARWQVDAHAFWRSGGNRHLTPDELAALPPEQMSRAFTEHTLQGVYDYESHIRIGEALEGRGALPATFMSLAPGSHHPDVWADVNRMLTLNTEQSRRAQAMHVCPLQFDIVDRLIGRFSNPGDLVFDPFGGLFTVPVRALMAGRRGRAAELNPGYFLDGVKYLQAQERKRDLPTLFDLDDTAGAA